MNDNLCGTLFDLFDEKVVRFLSGLLGGGILPSSIIHVYTQRVRTLEFKISFISLSHDLHL